MKQIIAGFLLLIFFVYGLHGQELVLNEVMSSNNNTVRDEDSDFPDWIEIFNYGSQPVDLYNCSLSDNTALPFKWRFPHIDLGPGEFFIVFASGKDRSLWAPHWESIIQEGDTWKFRPGTSPLPADWMQPDFNDQTWSSGPSGFGYGDGDDGTHTAAVISIFLRHSFTLDDTASIVSAQLHIDYDDAYVAYLNGIEIARANIGIAGTAVPYNQTADTPREAEMYQGGLPEVVTLSGNELPLRAGDNLLAIQVHNVSSGSSDLSAIPFFSVGMTTVPAASRPMPEWLKFALPQLHTNFRLSAAGEVLTFRNSTGVLVDSLPAVSLQRDISYGRQPDGWSSWMFFDQPTPRASNSTSGYTGITDPPVPSLPGGFYSTPQSVSLTSGIPASQIRYTLDGSIPTDSSALYSSPLFISQTAVLRARSFAPGFLTGSTMTHSYFINVNNTLPVFSLSTDPDNLWDTETGIYVLGESYEPEFPHFGANFWQDWERPVHFEIFENDAQPAFGMDGGMKILGGWTRAFPQKSLAVFARRDYGYAAVDYPLFPDRNADQYQSFVLRNSGNDWNTSMIRDALMTGLAAGTGLDLQAYRPVVVYLNGEYWGIHNLREKVSEEFLAQNHNIDPDLIDLLENNVRVIQGNAESYNQLLDLLHTSDITDPLIYARVSSMMDIANFIEYQVAQIYFDNTDWPGNNLKYWRSSETDGRWRWILFDTDFGFGMWDPQKYMSNTLTFALEPNGPEWPNPPWSTFMLRKLLENQSFRIEFINRFADRLNNQYSPQAVYEKINELTDRIEAEMPAHFSRWGGSVSAWQDEIDNMIFFGTQRHFFLRDYIRQEFNITGEYLISLTVNNTAGGTIRINSMNTASYPWRGIYFANIPVEISALAKPGWAFESWSGDIISRENSLLYTGTEDLQLQAHFIPDTIPDDDVVITEINYNPAAHFDVEDWVEFYNNTDHEIDMSGWQFLDSEDIHRFVFPPGTVIQPDSFIVICRDSLAFKGGFPNVYNLAGQFNFGLNGAGELIRLLNARDMVIDSLTYDDRAPWPLAPDGNGPTLALSDPSSDNSLAANWYASSGYGTPGKVNEIFTGFVAGKESNIPLKFNLAQNYPNPFNPDTNIEFDLPAAGRVTVVIYDLNGRLVDQLMDGYLAPGSYRISWHAGPDLASGIYFYRLSVKDQISAAKKMILIR